MDVLKWWKNMETNKLNAMEEIHGLLLIKRMDREEVIFMQPGMLQQKNLRSRTYNNLIYGSNAFNHPVNNSA